MKTIVFVAIILFAAGGVGWNLHRHTTAIVAERNRLETEFAQSSRQLSETTNAIARLGAEWASLQANPSSADRSAQLPGRASSNSPSLSPSAHTPNWSEADPFVWIEKTSIRSLGLAAFASADSGESQVPAEAARRITQASRAFLVAHPEFHSSSASSPEHAAELQADYLKMLSAAAAGLDEPGRRAIADAMRQIESLPIAGRMTQPTPDYRLNIDVADLLGLTTVERELVERSTSQIIERHRALELRNVAASDDHALESSSPRSANASFKVTAFPAEGRSLREEWTAQLEATLGASRTQHLLQMSASWIESDLGDFGEAERTITFREGGGSFGISDRNTKGFNNSMGTGGPTPVPPGWRHLIARPPEGGLPRLRSAR